MRRVQWCSKFQLDELEQASRLDTCNIGEIIIVTSAPCKSVFYQQMYLYVN